MGKKHASQYANFGWLRFGDIFVRLYGCIGIDCILRYIITMALLFTI